MEHLYIEPVNSNRVYEHTILDAQIQDTISISIETVRTGKENGKLSLELFDVT